MENTEPKSSEPKVEPEVAPKEAPKEEPKVEPTPEVTGEETKEEAKEIPAEKPKEGERETSDLFRNKKGQGMYERVAKTKFTPVDPKKEEERKQMKKNPKRKMIMITGYNGAEFCGSQKQSDDSIRTVENVLEKALFDAEMIDYRNYGDLKKIRWTRATRTDKRVHALQN